MASMFDRAGQISGHVGDGLQRARYAADPGQQWATRPAGSSTGPALWSLGLLMGAAAMYLLDVENGEQRRTAVAHRVAEYRNEVERTLDREGERAERALARLQGTARSALWRVRESMVSDKTILREINARLEDVMPFEEAAQLRISVQRGRVCLEGYIAEEHLKRLLVRIATVPGVRGLDNRLSVRASSASRPNTGTDQESSPGA